MNTIDRMRAALEAWDKPVTNTANAQIIREANDMADAIRAFLEACAEPVELPPQEGPRRRVVMIAKIEADDWDGLQGELQHLATEIARHGKLSTSSISGGYSCGHIIVTSEDGSIDHDSWAKRLDEYLERLKRERLGDT